MKISEQWLREWVNPKQDTKALAALLTMSGLEVSQLLPVAGDFQSVVVAEVIETTPHPEADKLTLCLVNDGKDKPYQVVCGAWNVKKGLKVALAKVGATLPQGMVIQAAKLRGQDSCGMLCSAAELGLEEKSEGIMELPETAKVGQSLFEYLKLDDTIFEIELTPNRGDCLSVQGIAREVAAKLHIPMTFPKIPAVTHTKQASLPVCVEAPKACPWYLGCSVKNIRPHVETPLWIKERLRRAGVRSIHPVVDVTQYVMLALGQPMHAFSQDKIGGGIVVRESRAGESLTLLDEQTVEIKPNTLLIADKQKPLALAGIMGGLESAVQSDTRDIFLESAFFTPVSLAGKARQYGLVTDAAYRYERGVDPNLPLVAMQYALSLLQAIVGGEVGEITSVKQQDAVFEPKTVEMRPAQFEKIMGVSMSQKDMKEILQALGLKLLSEKKTNSPRHPEPLHGEGSTWLFEIPSYRFDIQIEADLMEELMRLKGYDTLPASKTVNQLRQGKWNHRFAIERLATATCAALGYQETISYSFVDPTLQKALFNEREALLLANPLSPELSAMRVSLWPGLISSMLYNVRRQQASVALFECGNIFDVSSKTLQEHAVVAGLLTGAHGFLQWSVPQRAFDFYDMKGDVEALLSKLTSEPVQFVPKAHEALHPSQSACLMIQDKVVGWCGTLHPSMTQALDVPTPVFLFECWLEALPKKVQKPYQPVSKYPKIRRDLAFLVAEQCLFSEIERVIKTVDDAGILKSVDVFDIYQGEGIPAGKKSLALTLTLQSQTQTLQEEVAQVYLNKLSQALHQELGMILRDGHECTE